MKNTWSKENLEKIIKESLSQTDVLKKLGLRNGGDNYKTLRKYIELYEINVSHFLTCFNNILNLKKITLLNDILIEKSTFDRGHLKEKLYKEGLKEPKCELCGQTEEWNGKKMSLILDHINGVYNDNRIENLRIVCPNCNSTLDTHCGKNKKKKIYYCECGNIKHKNSNKCIKCKSIEQRKIKNRPEYEILKKEIEIYGYTGTGRKYKVSDNCIRKWLKDYLEQHIAD